MPLFHPLYLYSVKKSSRVNTNDSYAKTKRSKQWSELYIFSKCLLSTVLAISIPLCSPLLTIFLLLVSSGVQIFAVSKATFKNKCLKISRIVYISTHAALHSLLLVIYIFNQIYYNLQAMMVIGYVGIGLIIFNMAH